MSPQTCGHTGFRSGALTTWRTARQRSRRRRRKRSRWSRHLTWPTAKLSSLISRLARRHRGCQDAPLTFHLHPLMPQASQESEQGPARWPHWTHQTHHRGQPGPVDPALMPRCRSPTAAGCGAPSHWPWPPDARCQRRPGRAGVHARRIVAHRGGVLEALTEPQVVRPGRSRPGCGRNRPRTAGLRDIKDHSSRSMALK